VVEISDKKMANKIEEYKTLINKELTDKSKPWTQWFDLLEAKTGVPRIYSFLGELSIFKLFLELSSLEKKIT
jgi:hypothetical protein